MSAAVSDLVLSLADCKQLLGLRYAEWCSATPTLEADIAAAAMGLDDLGHSRVLAGCLSELGPDPRGPERESDPAAYRNVAFLDDTWTEWEQFVAANAILDTAFSVMIESLVEGKVEILRTRLRKMLGEERFHFLHGRSWLNELGMSPAVEQAWLEAVEWFGPDGGKLRRKLADKLERAEPKFDLDWSKWDPVRRRTRPGAIDRHTFDMLRGLEERRYDIARAETPARG
ncbi:MAG TPA: Phenylacetic acid catabolic protein [Candidatus Dormibacteraeota bacterium]